MRRFAVILLASLAALSGIALALLVSPNLGKRSIGGDLSTLLYPGGGGPLDLVLTNPHSYDVQVTSLRVRVRTSDPACSGDVNYAIAQYSGGYPLTLRHGGTRLSALVPGAAAWPQVSMHNLPTNQDACKDVRLSLDYEGQASG